MPAPDAHAPAPEIDESDLTDDLAPLDDLSWGHPAERAPTGPGPEACIHRGGSAPCVPLSVARGWPAPDRPSDPTSFPYCACGSARVSVRSAGRSCVWLVDNVGWVEARCVACEQSHDRCLDCGHRRRTPDDPVCGCRQPARGLGEYHSGRSGDPVVRAIGPGTSTLTLDDDLLVGWEIEIMPRGDAPAITPGRGVAHRDPIGALLASSAGAWIASVESDASLSDSGDRSTPRRGAEIVTRPAPLTVWREALPSLMAAITRIGTAAHPSCGGHMHVSACPQSILAGRVLCATYALPGQVAAWSALAGRDPSYSPPPPTHPHTSPDLPPSHAASLGWGIAGRTIEWRHPSGTDDPRVMLGRAEILIDVMRHALAHRQAQPSAPWGWGLYLRDRPAPTDETRYGFALLRSLGY